MPVKRIELYLKVCAVSSCRCLGDITQCTNGYSIALWLSIPEESLYPTTGAKFFISSGGETRSIETGGMVLLAKETGLWIDFRVRPDGKLWTISEINAVANSWFHMAITWDRYGDLTVFINGIRRYMTSGEVQGFTSAATSSVIHVGKTNTDLTSFGNFSLDEWFFWSKTLSDEMVTLIYNLY